MKVIDLLLHVDAAIMFITFVLIHGFVCLLVLLFDLVKYFLQLIEVKTAPSLKLRMVSIA